MTDLRVTDSLKILRETLCTAQGMVARSDYEFRRDEHAERLGRLIADIDRQRPLGSDGKHGNLHTTSCDCDV